LDPSFRAGGRSLSNFGGNSYDTATGVALQPDGNIVVGGYSDATDPNFDFAVARLLNPQGVFDTSFGSGGKSLAPYASSTNDVGNALALQPDGKIVVAGYSNAGGNYNFAVVRLLNPSGTFDSGFGADAGGQLVDFGGADRGNAVALQPDGKIVVAGNSATVATNKFALARLLPGGGPDGAFSGDGKTTVDFGGGAIADAVALQSDGKIVVAGISGDSFAIARLLPDGGLDSSFAGDGMSTVDVGSAGTAYGVALQPDGKIVIAGDSGGNFAVARLQPNGLLDSTFGREGKTIVDFGAAEAGFAMALQPDGKIVVAGDSNDGASADFALVRLQGDPGGSAKNAKCAGKKATIIGTNGKNKLKGTKKRDVIDALGGKDQVKGLKGNDLICGGKGKDKLLGGPGKDKLLGEAGKDILLGGPGKDKVKGGAGKDVEKP
jgi:uncharacterized delta-60 repeat protein